MKNYIIWGVFLVFVAAMAFYFSSRSRTLEPEYGNLDAFAQCLTQKGVTMHGAYWCSHCQNQKKLFGDSFRYVTYVECTEEAQRCLSEKVSGYPTWTFPDGTRFAGEMSLMTLSERSGCLLP